MNDGPFKIEIQKLPTPAQDNFGKNREASKRTQLRLMMDFTVVEERIILKNTDPATAANYGIFMMANFPIYLLGAQCRFATAGTNGGAVTLDIEKLTDGTAKGAGVTMLASTFDLKGTINTAQNAAPSLVVADAQLAKGEAAALKLTGTPTSVADLIVSTWWGVLMKDLPV